MRLGYDLSNNIAQLDDYGFAVFGILEKRRYKIGETVDDWLVAFIRVLRKDNSDIFNLDSKSTHSEKLVTPTDEYDKGLDW